MRVALERQVRDTHGYLGRASRESSVSHPQRRLVGETCLLCTGAACEGKRQHGCGLQKAEPFEAVEQPP